MRRGESEMSEGTRGGHISYSSSRYLMPLSARSMARGYIYYIILYNTFGGSAGVLVVCGSRYYLPDAK